MTGQTCKLQVLTTTNVSYVFVLVNDMEICNQHQDQLVGAGCRNEMQVAQGQVMVSVCALVQAAFGCCILLLLVPKLVLTLCNFHCCIFLVISNPLYTNIGSRMHSSSRPISSSSTLLLSARVLCELCRSEAQASTPAA